MLMEAEWSLPSRQGGHGGQRAVGSELFSRVVGRVCRVRGSAWGASPRRGEMLVCTTRALAWRECTGKQGSLGRDWNVLQPFI